MAVNIGAVETFKDVECDKAQCVKILEEASEVFGAWQDWDRYRNQHPVMDYPKSQAAKAMRLQIYSECADVIQATCNLLASMGVVNFELFMDECRKRNERRGRM